MTLDEVLHPERDGVDPELRRVLFEMCRQRVDDGKLAPEKVRSELAHLLAISQIAPIDSLPSVPRSPHEPVPTEPAALRTQIGLLER